MRVAVFANERETSSFYRAYEPVDALARRGRCSVVVNGRDGTILPQMLDCDVALISRWQGRGAQKLIQQLHDYGIAVVWGHDDAVEHAPEFRRDALKLQKRRAEIKTLVRTADVVVTTSHQIAAHYREMGGDDVRVIENYLGPHFSDLEREPHAGLVLGWAAWIDHQADWRALRLREVVTRLLEAHPELHVMSVGMVDLQLDSSRYTRSRAVPFEHLGRALTQFDIGIAPIADHPFNASRSNIKVKEYAAAGVPWLASPIGPYEGLGEREGGRLVRDDEWFEHLDRLIRDHRGRRKLAKRGRKWAASQSIDRNVEPWDRALCDAIERHRAGRPTGARQRPSPMPT